MFHWLWDCHMLFKGQNRVNHKQRHSSGGKSCLYFVANSLCSCRWHHVKGHCSLSCRARCQAWGSGIVHAKPNTLQHYQGKLWSPHSQPLDRHAPRPAGGIAVDQILSLRDNFDTADVSLIYYPNTAVGNLTVHSWVSSASSLRYSTVNRAMMYGSVLTDPGVSLLAAEASSPDVEKKLDATIERITPKAATNGTRHYLWSNVRIPFLHALPGFDKQKPYDWVDVSLTKITQFSSLLGMPIGGINDTGAGNMTLQLSSCYHNLELSFTSSQCSVLSLNFPW
ncbi:hypothetical protein BKA80DRAFT_65943 [Phyllosticta citrichinensis]